MSGTSAPEIAVANIDETRETLDITWKDGHAGSYPLKYLRGECPCAGCRTEREESRSNPFRVLSANQRPPGTRLTDVEPVGRYGMRLTWNDGHQTGIYTFEYLREICPCELCRSARKPDDTPYVHGIYIPK